MKTLLFILFPLLGHSQLFVDMGAGIETSHSRPIAKISVGYELNNVTLEAVEQITVTRAVNSANYFGLKAGYRVFNFVPSVGYLYNYRNADDKSFNRVAVGYSLKYIYPIGVNGGLYAEGMYAEKSLQFTAGFHVAF